jgi:hypothetical protein
MLLNRYFKKIKSSELGLRLFSHERPFLTLQNKLFNSFKLSGKRKKFLKSL